MTRYAHIDAGLPARRSRRNVSTQPRRMRIRGDVLRERPAINCLHCITQLGAGAFALRKEFLQRGHLSAYFSENAALVDARQRAIPHRHYARDHREIEPGAALGIYELTNRIVE